MKSQRKQGSMRRETNQWFSQENLIVTMKIFGKLLKIILLLGNFGILYYIIIIYIRYIMYHIIRSIWLKDFPCFRHFVWAAAAMGCGLCDIDRVLFKVNSRVKKLEVLTRRNIYRILFKSKIQVIGYFRRARTSCDLVTLKFRVWIIYSIDITQSASVGCRTHTCSK